MKKWLAFLAVLMISGWSKQEAAAPAADTSAAPAPAVAAGEKQKVVVYNWTEYLPESALQAFTKETGIEVEYATYESNEAMYAKLKLLDGININIAIFIKIYLYW